MFFFKQKTAYDMRISDWSSDVCSSDLAAEVRRSIDVSIKSAVAPRWNGCRVSGVEIAQLKTVVKFRLTPSGALAGFTGVTTSGETDSNKFQIPRSEEHTSELQSLMRISYAVFCLKKKKKQRTKTTLHIPS